MSIPLATLEGITMYPDQRIQQNRRADVARRLLATQRAHALYGLDSDEIENLGGWYTKLKKGASKVASATISAAVKSGVPVVSQVASGVRAGGQIAEETGAIPSIFRTGSAASGTAPAEVATVGTTSTLPSWALPAGLAAIVAVLLVAKK